MDGVSFLNCMMNSSQEDDLRTMHTPIAALFPSFIEGATQPLHRTALGGARRMGPAGGRTYPGLFTISLAKKKGCTSVLPGIRSQ
jgi:hypothetical protein